MAGAVAMLRGRQMRQMFGEDIVFSWFLTANKAAENSTLTDSVCLGAGNTLRLQLQELLSAVSHPPRKKQDISWRSAASACFLSCKITVVGLFHATLV